MRLIEGEVPQPGAGEILIENHWVGVNRPDLLQRAGAYPPPPGASPILGLEAAGRVVAVGDAVTEWQVGDFVTALTPGGAYAEYCVAPAGHALPLPEGIGLREAASLPENWFTVWANVAEIGRLAAGERLLVHGGSSGIGLAAIQLGKLLGATVYATAGSAEKCDACKAFGADIAINYRTSDFVEIVKNAGGADVVLDMVGASYIPRNVSLLRPDGRLVMIAFLAGGRAELDFVQVMLKRLTITGSTMRPRSVAEKTAYRDALLHHVWPAFVDGRVRPSIYAEFPLEQAGDAHRLMESNAHIGKIILKVRGD
ncbi:MAG: NAD(P)H-quinone oxidoreductase [Betaproteobacteria bacterium]|nr:NAD(P)H-quinone oxidoreductase [Betaproteobacteria bacterium]